LVVYQTGLENDYSYNDEVNNSEPGYCTLEGGVFLTQVVLPWTIQRYLTSTSSSSEQTTGKKLAILSPPFPQPGNLATSSSRSHSTEEVQAFGGCSFPALSDLFIKQMTDVLAL
jgi:hypothetical protein